MGQKNMRFASKPSATPGQTLESHRGQPKAGQLAAVVCIGGLESKIIAKDLVA